MFIKSHGPDDMFLFVKGGAHGLIKGESTDPDHKEEIEVLRWSWGMQARPSLGGGTASGKASVNDLKIVKRLDTASTGLMLALRTNEPITKAVLTLRKAGGDPLEYLKITIEQGRVTGLTLELTQVGSGTELLENVSFSFNKITVDYVGQGSDGLPLGALSYSDQWSDGA